MSTTDIEIIENVVEERDRMENLIEAAAEGGHFEVGTYKHDGKIVKRTKTISLEGTLANYDIMVRLNQDGSEQEIGLTDDPVGCWFYHVNDGLLDVGPFPDAETAIADAVAYLKSRLSPWHPHHIRRLSSISINGAAAPTAT